MKNTLLVLVCAFAFLVAFAAADAGDNVEQIRTLEAKVGELQSKISAMTGEAKQCLTARDNYKTELENTKASARTSTEKNADLAKQVTDLNKKIEQLNGQLSTEKDAKQKLEAQLSTASSGLSALKSQLEALKNEKNSGCTTACQYAQNAYTHTHTKLSETFEAVQKWPIVLWLQANAKPAYEKVCEQVQVNYNKFLKPHYEKHLKPHVDVAVDKVSEHKLTKQASQLYTEYSAKLHNTVAEHTKLHVPHLSEYAPQIAQAIIYTLLFFPLFLVCCCRSGKKSSVAKKADKQAAKQETTTVGTSSTAPKKTTTTKPTKQASNKQ